MAFVTYTEETLRPLKSKWNLELPHLRSNASLCYHSERIIGQIYQNSGFKILARNYRNRGFEIDFIAARHDVIIAVEVKCRRSYPETQLASDRKKLALRRGLTHFIAQSAPDTWNTLRLDLALVLYNGRQFYTSHVETNI